MRGHRARPTKGHNDPESTVGMSTPPPAQPAFPPRYEVGASLGKGGFGAVWAGVDRHTAGPVALKLLTHGAQADVDRYNREVAALRLLNLPGVVRLRDSGIWNGRMWIAMDLVDGHPFPGVPDINGKVRWEDLAPTATALLDTLARVHDAGLVHRDLKPSNVLVDAAGRPHVLDFGIARGPGLGPTITETGQVLGTPRYMSPEQARGWRADARSDLYSFALMVYEALTGDIPLPAASTNDLLKARVARDAPPLRSRCPDVPAEVAEAIDRLLARDAARRPTPARVVLRRMGGHRLEPAEELPWLGDRAAILDAAERLRAGAPVWVVGPSGSGRTRFLREVLHELGESPLVLGPGRRPFESLTGVLIGADPVAEARALVADRVVLADDADEIDRWTLDALRETPLLAATRVDRPGALPLGPLPEAALRPLFAGPDRLLHLVEDPARVLHRRTGGLPGRIARELGRWVAADLARWRDGRLALDRVSLNRIEDGFAGYPAEEGGGDTDPEPEELLAWVQLAGSCPVPVLATARGQPDWQVRLQLLPLAQAGAVEMEGDLVRALRASAVLPAWSAEDRLAAHAALAMVLPPGSPGRLVHLLSSCQYGEAGGEAAWVAREYTRAGRASEALGLLAETIGVAEGVRTLTTEVVRAALAEGTGAALARAASLVEGRDVDPVAAELLAAARESDGGAITAATERLARLPESRDVSLDTLAWGLRVTLAARQSPALHHAMVADAAAWADGTGDPEARAAAWSWRAHVAYQTERFAEAATCAQTAAGLTREELHRLEFLYRAACSWMEEGEVARARDQGLAVRAAAGALRLTRLEARAEWFLRALADRVDGAGPVDHALVEAAAALDAPALEALIVVNEAAIAWRRGDHEIGGPLARRAEGRYRAVGDVVTACYARALAIAMGAAPPNAGDDCAQEAQKHGRVDITVATIGVLARAGCLTGDWSPVLLPLTAGLSDRQRRWRRGAISVEEAERAVRGG